MTLVITGRKAKWDANEKIEGAGLCDWNNRGSEVTMRMYNFYSVPPWTREQDCIHKYGRVNLLQLSRLLIMRLLVFSFQIYHAEQDVKNLNYIIYSSTRDF